MTFKQASHSHRRWLFVRFINSENGCADNKLQWTGAALVHTCTLTLSVYTHTNTHTGVNLHKFTYYYINHAFTIHWYVHGIYSVHKRYTYLYSIMYFTCTCVSSLFRSTARGRPLHQLSISLYPVLSSSTFHLLLCLSLPLVYALGVQSVSLWVHLFYCSVHLVRWPAHVHFFDFISCIIACTSDVLYIKRHSRERTQKEFQLWHFKGDYVRRRAEKNLRF